MSSAIRRLLSREPTPGAESGQAEPPPDIGVSAIWNLPERDPQRAGGLAEEAAARGEYEKAMRLLSKAAAWARDANNTAAANLYLVRAGDMALQAGLAVEALQLWKQVVLSDPKHEAAQERIVKLYLEFARLTGTFSLWRELQPEAEKLVEINPASAVGLHALGVALLHQAATDADYAERGEQRLRQAVQADQANPQYADDLAQFYAGADRPKEALAVYDSLIGHASGDANVLAKAHLYRGVFYLQTRIRKERELRQAASTTRPQGTETLRGEIADADERALKDLTRAVELDPGNADASVALGNYWQYRQPDADDDATRRHETAEFHAEAKEHYRQAIRVAPEEFDAYLRLARLHTADRDNDEALKVLRERMGRRFEGHSYLSSVHRLYMAILREEAFKIDMQRLVESPKDDAGRSGQPRQAILNELNEFYQQAVVDAPMGEDDFGALYMKGRLLMLQDKHHEAIQVLEKAGQLAGVANTDLLRTLGDLYLRVGVPGSAKETMLGAVKINPNDPGAWAMLATALLQTYDGEKAADLDQAIEAARRALELDPDNETARRALDEARRLKGDVK